MGGHLKGLGVGGPFGGNGGEDNGNDFARFFDDDAVVDADVFALNFVLVVEGGAFDGGASELNGLKFGNGGEDAGAAHLNRNIEQGGFGLFGLIFVGDGPAGAFGGGAEAFVEVALVDFDHSTVHFKGKLGAEAFELVEGAEQPLRIALFPALGGGAQPEGFELVEEVFVGIKLDAFALAATVKEGVEGPLCNFGGVEEFEGAGTGVAGIGEGFESVFLALLVEGLEPVAVEVNFTADFEDGGGGVGLEA